MPRRFRMLLVATLAAAVARPASPLGLVQGAAAPGVAAATSPQALRDWDDAVDRLLRDGRVETRRVDDDPLVPGRTHVRLRQVHHGVPILGAELVRQSDGSGYTVSLFGTAHDPFAVETTPSLGIPAAAAIAEAETGVALAYDRLPTLCIVPDEGGYRLAYQAVVFTPSGGMSLLIDAHTGEVFRRADAAQRQAAVGGGTGVLGDAKKLSVSALSGTYVADDAMRPPSLVTIDMRGDLTRTLALLNGRFTPGPADLAADADNTWDDGAAVDAHAYSGWFYDFYFKRFGRRGLDDNNFRMRSIVHPVSRQDITRQPAGVVGLFYLNAFYAGSGLMVYGEGLPPGLTANGQHWNYLAGALDVVAHELTHGVTDFTSRLLYEFESGALNESFSDMMATAAEHYFQPGGTGPLKADYLIAEDTITPGGIRSMANPMQYGQPDHYHIRASLPRSRDNGGVHTNSGIPNHVYYLAIEGGVNRYSGLAVEGVGLARREEIEKAMYRAFTQLMPPDATFAVARVATIQAAVDLYGPASPAARAIAQAWSAVGVP